MKRRKGFYSISVVAKMFSVHQQTIRMYEKEGLISPKRSAGNTRLFSEEDVDRLEEVIYLTHKLGVNLAGVEIILKLQKKIKRMQDEMNKLFASTEGEFELESQGIKEDMRKHIERLAEIRKENMTKKREHLIEINTPVVDNIEKSPQVKKRGRKISTQAQSKVPVKTEEKSLLGLLSKSTDRNIENAVDDVNDIKIDYDKD